MTETTSGKTQKIWLIAAISGLVAFLALLSLAGYSTVASLIVGVLVAVLVGILLWIGWYTDPESDSDVAQSVKTSAAAVTPSAGAATPPVAVSDNAATATPNAALDMTSTDATSAAAEVQAPVADPVVVKTTAAKKPAAAKPAKKAATKPAVKKAAAPKAATAKTPSEKAPAKAPVAKDGKPAVLTAPRASGADDLKLLKGVGPKLEQTLNALGFYHFDQVAGWRKKEIEWVDNNLKFKGRIERDGWVAQAKVLAKGGDTEFSKRSKK
jgi:predicted flap endonuclease-1-like 5' DNA nuclease